METEKRDVNSLGLTYVIDVPSNYATFDEMAGKANACLEEGISNVVYRGTNADFRAAILDAIEEKLVPEFGDDFKRLEHDSGKVKKVKDEDGNVTEEPAIVLEKEGVYFKRVVAQLVEGGIIASDAKEVVQAYFQSTIDEVMSATDDDGNPLVAFDPKQRERKVQSKRIPQYIRNTIDQLFGLGDDAVKSAAAKLQSELGFTVDPADKDSMAKALYARESSRNKDLERAKALAS